MKESNILKVERFKDVVWVWTVRTHFISWQYSFNGLICRLYRLYIGSKLIFITEMHHLLRACQLKVSYASKPVKEFVNVKMGKNLRPFKIENGPWLKNRNLLNVKTNVHVKSIRPFKLTNSSLNISGFRQVSRLGLGYPATYLHLLVCNTPLGDHKKDNQSISSATSWAQRAVLESKHL